MFKDYQDALVALLKAHLPPKVKVAAHGGRFSEAELNRLATEAPAVKVAILGSGQTTRRGGTSTAPLQVALFVVTSQSKGGSAEESALALVSAILPILTEGKIDLDAIAADPADLRCENLYSGQMSAQYTALWVISFTQSCELPSLTNPAALEDFVTAVTTWGNTGAVDHVTLPPHDQPKDQDNAP